MFEWADVPVTGLEEGAVGGRAELLLVVCAMPRALARACESKDGPLCCGSPRFLLSWVERFCVSGPEETETDGTGAAAVGLADIDAGAVSSESVGDVLAVAAAKAEAEAGGVSMSTVGSPWDCAWTLSANTGVR